MSVSCLDVFRYKTHIRNNASPGLRLISLTYSRKTYSFGSCVTSWSSSRWNLHSDASPLQRSCTLKRSRTWSRPSTRSRWQTRLSQSISPRSNSSKMAMSTGSLKSLREWSPSKESKRLRSIQRNGLKDLAKFCWCRRMTPSTQMTTATDIYSRLGTKSMSSK